MDGRESLIEARYDVIRERRMAHPPEVLVHARDLPVAEAYKAQVKAWATVPGHGVWRLRRAL